MFLPDKKKIQTVLKSRLSGGSAVETKSEEKLGVKDDAATAIAEEILSAIQEKSALGLAAALKKFDEYCEGSEEENGE